MSHLRLVTDAPTQRRKSRPRLRFTDDERAKLATALRNLHRRYGRWRDLADAMSVSVPGLMSVLAGRSGSMKMAQRAATLAGIPLERLLSGEIMSADSCATCGQRLVPKTTEVTR